jgi:CDP-4-dehydro-6-deoxyglucose reductase
LFVAGGTGIAPLRSMLIEHVARPTKNPVALIYSARSVDEFAFRPELNALESAGRISCYFTVTREETSAWQGRRGRISEALLKEALPSTDSTCLVCGPPQLVNDTRLLLTKLGVSESQILIEKY